MGVSDSVAQRIFTQKDVRWVQHCSIQVMQHLKTLGDVIHKGAATHARAPALGPAR